MKRSWRPKYQHMLQTLTDLTGYLTTQTYLTAAGGPSGYGMAGYTTSSALATPQQEEIRKEIRTLKGLALNRYCASIIPAVSGLVTHPTLQAYFCDPKGFIRHEYTSAMI